jgi:transposase
VAQRICGVDVSQAWLDVFGPDGLEVRLANTAEGTDQLGALLRDLPDVLVVMEASGGVERLAYHSLWAQGIACAVVNPRSVRDFAKAMGHLEKTDRIDARMIAGFAAAKGVAPAPPPSAKQQELSELSARQRQVIGDLITQKQRLHTARGDRARAGLLAIIALLKAESKALAAATAALIGADPLWAAIDAELRSVKGVADRTIAVLMADLPELGTLTGREIAKLAGLAPLADDSGKRQGKRRVRGGRASVRNILFLVADIVRKYNPSLAEFRTRLLAQGKPKMVVRIAMAHKLLTRLNAKARDIRQNHKAPA